MCWDCFSGNRTGLFKIIEAIEEKDLNDILKKNLKVSASYHFGRQHFTFQHDNDSKHKGTGKKIDSRTSRSTSYLGLLGV